MYVYNGHYAEQDDLRAITAALLLAAARLLYSS